MRLLADGHAAGPATGLRPACDGQAEIDVRRANATTNDSEDQRERRTAEGIRRSGVLIEAGPAVDHDALHGSRDDGLSSARGLEHPTDWRDDGCFRLGNLETAIEPKGDRRLTRPP
jgi:hypothetical protein